MLGVRLPRNSGHQDRILSKAYLKPNKNRHAKIKEEVHQGREASDSQ